MAASHVGDLGSFVLQVIRGRWFMIFACLQIMAIAGVNYLFSLYSNDIKSAMGYDQATLNLVSVSKDFGCYIGLITSLISEVTPPWVVLSIGAVMNFFGYFMIWLAVTGHLKRVSLWQMCVYICIACNSQTFIDTGTFVTCVKNFPKSRGIVMGLLMGNVGLSGAILTQLYHAFYSNKSAYTLILLFAWLPTVVLIIFLRAIRIMKVAQQQNEEVKIFYHLLYISLTLAGFLMVIIIVQNMVNFTRAGYYASALTVILILVIPLVIAMKEEYQKNQKLKNDSTNEIVVQTVSKQPPITALNEDPKDNDNDNSSYCLTNIFNPPNRGEDYTILQAIFSIDMLLLSVSTICGLGGTLTAVDNMGQIGRSLGYPTHTITTFVSLVCIWNSLGRLTSGFASDFALTKYKFPRPMITTFLLLLSCVGHLLIAFPVPHSLYVASVIIGFCFGAQGPLLNATISELFGLKNFSMLFNFGTLAIPVGSFLLNAVVTGKLYDREAMQQLVAKGLTRKEGDDLNCFGAQCYRLSFIIIAGVSLFGCLVSFILVLRTRNFYKGDIYKKFRENANAQ